MAGIDWPLALPEPRSGTLSESRVAAYADDKAEVGASRRRKRFTRTLRRVNFDLVLIGIEKALLETFRDSTTDGGAFAFNWQHPDGSIYEMRFADLPTTRHVARDIWTSSIALEEV